MFYNIVSRVKGSTYQLPTIGLDHLGLKEKITFSHKCNEKVFLKIKARASTRIVDYKEKVDQRGC